MSETSTKLTAQARRRLPTYLLLVLVLAVGFGLGTLRPWLMRPPLVIGQDAVSGTGATPIVSLDQVGGAVINIGSADREATMVMIIYPGAEVRPQAYEWLGHELASRGIQVLIPEMPFDLAVLGKDRAEELIAHYAHGRPVVLAGHSLGGAMAADYASRRGDQLAGLVLMAAYPASNVTVARPPTLSLLAELDHVADAADVRDGLTRLPANTKLVVINGAVHSFFGRYGPQAGDGQPTVDRRQAEQQIATSISEFCAGLAG